MDFTKDNGLDAEASVMAENAVEFVESAFKRRLDFTDKSIENIELVLSAIHDDTRTRQINEDKIRNIAVMLGYYIGEVFRRNYGAEWGWVSSGDDRHVGIRSLGKQVLFWPAGKG